MNGGMVVGSNGYFYIENIRDVETHLAEEFNGEKEKIISSLVSLKTFLLSECPKITYLTPKSSSMETEFSPVKAPSL